MGWPSACARSAALAFERFKTKATAAYNGEQRIEGILDKDKDKGKDNEKEIEGAGSNFWAAKGWSANKRSVKAVVVACITMCIALCLLTTFTYTFIQSENERETNQQADDSNNNDNNANNLEQAVESFRRNEQQDKKGIQMNE